MGGGERGMEKGGKNGGGAGALRRSCAVPAGDWPTQPGCFQFDLRVVLLPQGCQKLPSSLGEPAALKILHCSLHSCVVHQLFVRSRRAIENRTGFHLGNGWDLMVYLLPEQLGEADRTPLCLPRQQDLIHVSVRYG